MVIHWTDVQGIQYGMKVWKLKEVAPQWTLREKLSLKADKVVELERAGHQ